MRCSTWFLPNAGIRSHFLNYDRCGKPSLFVHVSPLSRFDPKKDSILVVLLLNCRAANVQTSIVKTSQRRIFGAVAKEHGRSKPFADPLSRLTGCETCDQCSTRL